MNGRGAEAFERWLPETLDLVYAAGLDPSLWNDVTGHLAAQVPGTTIVMQGADTRSERCLGVVQTGLTSEAFDDFVNHYANINPWLRMWRPKRALEAFLSDDIMPSTSLRHTEFYNDFMKPVGGVDSAAGIKVFDEPDRFGWIAVHYGADRAEAYNAAMPRILRRLAPAVRSALVLNRELSAKAASSRALDQLLEALALPAFVLDADGNLRFANARAAACVSTPGLLGLGASDRLRIGDRVAANRFADAVRGVHQGTKAGDEIVLRSPRGTAELVLSLFPLTAPPALSPGLSWLYDPGRLVLVLVRDLRQAPVAEAALLRNAFGLTAAEARLAARLMTGESLEDAAGMLTITKGTARVQLKAIFAKTETHRQAELVATLLRLSRPL